MGLHNSDMPTESRFAKIKPAQLVLSMAFPQAELSQPLAPLIAAILDYGILCPLVVRPNDEYSYVVLKGRRTLQAVWELQNEGHEKLFRWLPCYIIESTGPLMDLKLFIRLNTEESLSAGDMEATLACIEQVENTPPHKVTKKSAKL